MIIQGAEQYFIVPVQVFMFIQSLYVVYTTGTPSPLRPQEDPVTVKQWQ